VGFQLSQRADFYEELVSTRTTFARPVVNSRNEPLCGNESYQRGREGIKMARLHSIFFDNTLSQIASLLKVGTMQILLAQIEAETIDPNLILDDPLEAVIQWSHDPTLEARARTAAGQELTAVELQLLFFEKALQFVARGRCKDIVPHAEQILQLWGDTLNRLAVNDFAALAPRLDWVQKYCLLDQATLRRPELSWDSPKIK